MNGFFRMARYIWLLSAILALGDRQKAILALALRARANIAFWRSPGPILHSWIKHRRPCAKSHFIIFLLLFWPCKISNYNVHNLLDRWKISSDSNVLFKDGSFEVLFYRCGINNKKKLVIFQGHCKVQCFVSTEYSVLDRWKISSDSNVLFKGGSFEVLSHRCVINNKEVSRSSRSHLVKYILYGGP